MAGPRRLARREPQPPASHGPQTSPTTRNTPFSYGNSANAEGAFLPHHYQERLLKSYNHQNVTRFSQRNLPVRNDRFDSDIVEQRFPFYSRFNPNVALNADFPAVQNTVSNTLHLAGVCSRDL